MAECEEGIRVARETAGFNARRLKIGSLYSLTLRCIPKVMIGLKLRKPTLDIDLTLGSNRDLLQQLNDGRLDAIVIGLHPPANTPLAPSGSITPSTVQEQHDASERHDASLNDSADAQHHIASISRRDIEGGIGSASKAGHSGNSGNSGNSGKFSNINNFSTMTDSADSALVAIPLFDDDVCLAAPQNSPYAGRTAINLQCLREEKFITLTEGFVTSQDFDTCFANAGFSPRIGMRVQDVFSLMNLVSGGMGYGLLPGRIGRFSSRIELIPLVASQSVRQRITLLLPKTRERDPNLLALAAECRMYGRNDTLDEGFL